MSIQGEDSLKGDTFSPTIAATPALCSRKCAHGNCSFAAAFINFVKSIFGIGVLNLPFAFKSVGWLEATILMTLLLFLTIYVTRLLLETSSYLEFSQPHSLAWTYLGIAEEAHGRIGYWVAWWSVVGTSLMCCAAYIVFVAANFHAVFPNLSMALVMALTALVLALLCSHGRLGQLVVVSTVGLFFNVAAAVAVVGWGLVHRVPGSPAVYDFAVSTARMQLSHTGAFLGTASFALATVPLALPVQRSMLHPERFEAVSTLSMSLCAAFYVFFGFLGWYCFGANTNPVVSLNVSGVTGTVLRLALCVTALATYPVQLYVSTVALTDAGPSSVPWPVYSTASVAVTLLVAFVLPDFSNIISLTGCVFGVLSCYLLPTLFHVSLCPQSLPRWLFHVLLCAAFVAMALCSVGANLVDMRARGLW